MSTAAQAREHGDVATEALRDVLPPRARVRRGGAPVEIDATALVPGDLLLLAEGDRLSADARLIAGAVEVDMSPLTGESQPVTRSAERSQPAAATLEAEDLVFAGWSPGDATGEGAPLHHAYLMATTMSFAGITACQVGTAFASRTDRASLREIGVFSNPLLLGGISFMLVFAAALIYLPPLQSVFHTAALGLPELALLACFPVIVWGSDELRRAWRRRHYPTMTGAP